MLRDFQTPLLAGCLTLFCFYFMSGWMADLLRAQLKANSNFVDLPPHLRPDIPKDSLLVQIASDFHSEFIPLELLTEPWILKHLVTPSAPILALLGDIGIPGDPRYERILQVLAPKFERIWLLAGNHEFYQHSKENPRTAEQVTSDIKTICARYPNVLHLERSSMLVHGVRVLATTLWSHIPAKQAAAVSQSMNDYRKIYVFDDIMDAMNPDIQTFLGVPEYIPGHVVRLATVDDTNHWHDDNVAWLHQHIGESRSNGERAVLVLTHHAPSVTNTSAPQFDSSHPAFASDLQRFFKNWGTTVHTWVYGHTHYSSDEVQQGTRLVSNQRGYYQQSRFESQTYAPTKVIKV